jgi:hypothetical protein
MVTEINEKIEHLFTNGLSADTLTRQPIFTKKVLARCLADQKTALIYSWKP